MYPLLHTCDALHEKNEFTLVDSLAADHPLIPQQANQIARMMPWLIKCYTVYNKQHSYTMQII